MVRTSDVVSDRFVCARDVGSYFLLPPAAKCVCIGDVSDKFENGVGNSSEIGAITHGSVFKLVTEFGQIGLFVKVNAPLYYNHCVVVQILNNVLIDNSAECIGYGNIVSYNGILGSDKWRICPNCGEKTVMIDVSNETSNYCGKCYNCDVEIVMKWKQGGLL
jgi:ribosomal protein S27AE